jgi:Zn-dependent metalloprotease
VKCCRALKTLSVVSAFLFALVGFGFGTWAEGQQELAPTAAQEAHLEELRQASAAPLKAEFDSETGRVKTLLGRFAATSVDRPTAAQAFLSRYAHLMKLRPDLGDLQLTRQVEDRGGTSLTFEQKHQGVPVFEGSVLVGFDPDGSIVHVHNGHVPDLALSTTPTLSPSRAVSVAESMLGTAFPEGHGKTRLVVVRGDKRHPGYYLAWQVSGVLAQPRGDWHVFVDARTGEVVRWLNLMKSAGSACIPCNPLDLACGAPFRDNPVDTLDNTGLTDASTVDLAQFYCTLNNLTSLTNLDGTWANTSLTKNRVGPPYTYLRSANQRAVDEVNAYYHANRSKEYLDSLGFPGVMAFSIRIDAHNSSLGDNSQYVPSGDYMEFGEGGVDDSQDADVVYHEYGHAIQDNQVPNYGTTDEGGATGEGFGDYWAAALTDEHYAPALGPECVAAWDAVAYNPYDGSPGSGCLRRVDGSKQYPRDFVWEVHDDGEIWSAALWSLREQLGAATADALVVKSHTFLASNANFNNAADALLSADNAMNGGNNASTIHNAMKTHGIPRTGTAAPTSGMTSFATFACQSKHSYKNFDYKECKVTVPKAARVRLRFSRFETESGFDFVYISDGDYRQVQKLSGKPFGNKGAGFSAAVSGDTIVARFKADYSVTKWGFAIDRVYYSTTP